MVKIYILIISLSQGTSQGGSSTIVSEFSSKAKCDIALLDQKKQISQKESVRIISAGCYEK